MPRATCRCGQKLSLPVNGPDRVICPKCAARVRVRRDPPRVGSGDGFIRFRCPCGRRLKVRPETGAGTGPQAGKCPDCGRIVPVPAEGTSSGALKLKGYGAETPTEELSPEDFAALERWAAAHLAPSSGGFFPGPGSSDPGPSLVSTASSSAVAPPPPPSPASVKIEAGLRVCPRCGRPIHLSAVACRECGAPVPKR